MKIPENFRRNPSSEKKGQKALVVIQDLSWGSFFPLISVYFKQRSFSIYYLRTSRGGLRLGSLLVFLKISISAPLKINDLYYVDTPHAVHWRIQHEVVKVCRDQINSIETLIKTYLPERTAYFRKILSANVMLAWQLWLVETLLLRAAAKQLGKQEGISDDRVIVISRYVSLLRILNLDSSTNNDISLLAQPNQNRALLYTLGAVASCLWEVCLVSFRYFFREHTISSKSTDALKIGVTAAWGAESMEKVYKDDFFWWRNSTIEPNRLLYMFERKDFQPTRDKVEQAQKLGFQSTALNSKFLGDNPNLLIKNNEEGSLLESLQMFGFALKLGWKALSSDEHCRAVSALVAWQYISGKKLSRVYKKLNLKGVFHFEEVGMDMISLASAFNDSIRIGTHWSSHHGISTNSCRNHQVYFLWGQHDAQLALDAGSVSRSMLIAGSFVCDYPNKETNSTSRKKVDAMRKRGVRYVLALLDNSPPCPEFYQFFLEWLVEDPCLGLLIKSKGDSWNKMRYDNPNTLVEHAYQTNRLHDLDFKSGPSDAARLSDFTIAVTSISALAVSAIEGARVLFLDYERTDQGPQKAYCILHSLGLNRCVFYEPKLLRQSLMDYFENPASNPYLGDATPILDQLDPFRDGKAHQRIGEFVAWYLEEIDKGSNSEDAVRNATDKYAEKWGEDKVVQRV